MSKKEFINIYDLGGGFLRTEERAEYYVKAYAQYRRDGFVSTQVLVVKGLLLTPQGRCYLQLRSKDKKENACLVDKTVAGHVAKGVSSNVAFVMECVQELGVPVCVVSNDEFPSTTNSLDLSIISIVKQLEVVNAFQSERRFLNGEKMIFPQISVFYIGYFNGPIQFQDGEASGILSFSRKELIEEVKANPEKFTKDIVWMISRYADEIKAL